MEIEKYVLLSPSWRSMSDLFVSNVGLKSWESMTLGALSDGTNALCTPNTVPVPAALDNVLMDTLQIAPHNPWDILPSTQHFTPPSSPLDPLTWREYRLCLVCGGKMLRATKSRRNMCDQVIGHAITNRLRPPNHVIRH